MRAQTLRFGVIGAGYLGRHHARIYSALAQETQLELAAVCDMDAARAREVAETYGTGFFTDYRQILPMVDAVSIVTPTASHYEVAMGCLRAGKDVLLEKPICATMREAGEVLELAREKGLILQAGHVERYNPAAGKALSMVERPLFIEAQRTSPFPERSLDVDVTLDMMIHDIDLALNALGCPEVRDIKAAGARIITPNLDTAQAWVDFENDCSAFFSVSRVAAEKKRVIEFIERGRVVKADLLAGKVALKTRDFEGEVETGPAEPLREELADFARCVKTRTAPRVSPLEARRALELALRISEIIRSVS
ncbi:MAG: Gfo/Idh/MocA family oxidoreductase [Nitrospiraceae bacterium]|nr:Gfo/Idh/MocA family oxidoreductase [Nitrospiraceae bacterium]